MDGSQNRNLEFRGVTMKIGILGAHGTGKSTLAMSLAAEHKKRWPGRRVAILQEVARGCPLAINKQTTDAAQRWIYHQQISAEIEMSAGADILVCDRTVLDNLAYAERAGLNDLIVDCFGEALRWMATYSEIHFLSPNGEIAADGFRDTDPGFQADIDKILAGWIKRFQLNVIEH